MAPRFVDQDAKFRGNHQILLQQYLLLQKECVLKKRKLKEAKERKQTVLDEVRFLRRRRKFLIKKQSQTSERQDGTQPQKADADHEAGPSGRYVNATEPAFQNSRLTMGLLSNSGKEKVGFEPLRIGKRPKKLKEDFTDEPLRIGKKPKTVKEEFTYEPLKIGKNPKNLFPNEKQAPKKTTWQDQLALKV